MIGISWNDDWNKSKFELYIKENLPKMEEQYTLLQIHQKEVLCKQEKEKMRENEKKIKIMELLTHMVSSKPSDVNIIQDRGNYQTILEKYNIPIYEYEEFKKINWKRKE